MLDLHSHSTGPPLMPIERPRYPKCRNRMNLVRIMLGSKGLDLRNFECKRCDHVVTVTVAIDPTKSDKAG
jgi:hypothetical protein